MLVLLLSFALGSVGGFVIFGEFYRQSCDVRAEEKPKNPLEDLSSAFQNKTFPVIVWSQFVHAIDGNIQDTEKCQKRCLDSDPSYVSLLFIKWKKIFFKATRRPVSA